MQYKVNYCHLSIVSGGWLQEFSPFNSQAAAGRLKRVQVPRLIFVKPLLRDVLLYRIRD